ncbi:hypothetical protein GCM10007304_17470 [Rhodococcoides trifolii]|uniref:Holin n=1 Tax=Rhodococcoides trifolii TaxID=908250 RepID=A0A917CZY1_9NOCA|nr:holin [Rhodococcus trifolii]GGG03844.1 hypothetical protein GCM10007304_17470 [Rhodococcus trifolii]
MSAPITSLGSRVFLLDVLDRTIKTFIQNVLLFLGAGAVVTTVSWQAAFGSAGLAALVSFLIALASATAITSGNPLVDILDRAARTFFGSLVGAIPVTGGLLDVHWGDALTIAGTAVLVSVLTSLLSLNLGATKGIPTLAPVAPAVPQTINPTGSITEFRS